MKRDVCAAGLAEPQSDCPYVPDFRGRFPGTDFRGHDTQFLWRRRFAGKLRSWLASHAWSCPAGRITSPKRGNRRQPTFFGPDDYPWSSAAPHAAGRDDRLVAAAPLLTLDPKWNEHLEAGVPEGDVGLFRRHEATGRPLGSAAFVSRLEALLGRILRSEPPGRKAKLGVGDN